MASYIDHRNHLDGATTGSHPKAYPAHLILDSFARELTEQSIKHYPTQNGQAISQAIDRALKKLTRKDVIYLTLRYEKLKEQYDLVDEKTERGFWKFFHDELHEAQGWDQRNSDNRDIHFFNKVLGRWNNQPAKFRKQRFQMASKDMITRPAPKMPTNSELPELRTSDDPIGERHDDPERFSNALQMQYDAQFDLEETESELQKEFELVKRITSMLSRSRSSELKHWLKDFGSVSSRQKCEPLKQGILGVTGAGKSSLINAVLGEKLLPESSRKACTPCMIAIAYNPSPDTNYPIRVTVHFIDKESWFQDISKYLQAIRNVNDGNYEALAQDDEDWEQIHDKVSVLYPDLTPQDMSQMSSDELLEQTSISDHLGQSQVRLFRNSEEAYIAMGDLFEESEQTAFDTTQNSLPPLWPLIKFIQVETPNEMLRHGIVMYDLPGTQDSNSARSSVAEERMRECSGLSVVTPLSRAADEASALGLFGKASQSDIHLRNMTLTYVGTKSDDMGSLSHEIKHREVRDEIGMLKIRMNTLDVCIAESKAQIAQLTQRTYQADAELFHPKRQISRYEELEKQIKGGQALKKSSLDYSGNKRKRHDSDINGTNALPSNEEGFLQASDLITTIEELKEFLHYDELQTHFSNLSAKASKIATDLSLTEQECRSFEEEHESITPQMWQVCISARNEANKKAIRTSVAKKLRQNRDAAAPNAGNQDETLPMSDTDITNFVAALPIFTVSAKAFHELAERSTQTNKKIRLSSTESYSIEQTMIPALVQHYIQQAKGKRRAHADRIMSQIVRSRTSLLLIVSGNMFNQTITDRQLEKARQDLDISFKKLQKDISDVLEGVRKSFSGQLTRRVFGNVMKTACQLAVDKSVNTTTRFGKSITSVGSYRAIMTRNGAFTGSSKVPMDLNLDLLQPINNKINEGWSIVFTDCLSNMMAKQYNQCRTPMLFFKNSICQTANEYGCPAKIVDIIEEQNKRYLAEIEDASNAYRQDILFHQRSASHELYRVFQKEMAPGYAASASFKGKGALGRMKQNMETHVANVKDKVFTNATKAMKKELEQGLRKHAVEFTANVDAILANMHRDYQNIFKRSEEKVDKAEIDLQYNIQTILEQDELAMANSKWRETVKQADAIQATQARQTTLEEDFFMDEN